MSNVRRQVREFGACPSTQTPCPRSRASTQIACPAFAEGASSASSSANSAELSLCCLPGRAPVKQAFSVCLRAGPPSAQPTAEASRRVSSSGLTERLWPMRRTLICTKTRCQFSAAPKSHLVGSASKPVFTCLSSRFRPKPRHFWPRWSRSWHECDGGRTARLVGAQAFHRGGRPRAIALGRPSCATLGPKVIEYASPSCLRFRPCLCALHLAGHGARSHRDSGLQSSLSIHQ